MDTERFKETVGRLDKIRKGEAKTFLETEEQNKAFLEEFNLLDPREFPAEQINL